MLRELHNQIKTSNDSRSKKNSKAKKNSTIVSESKPRKEKKDDDDELDISVLEFLDSKDEDYSDEEVEESGKSKVKESAVTFRIDKDAVRSRQIGSITVSTINDNPSSTSSIYETFPVNASVLSFNSARMGSKDRVSLSRFKSLKQVGPSKVFSKSKK